MTQKPRNTLNNRKTKSEAAGEPRTIIKTLEFIENTFLFRDWYTNTGIPNL
jgi:hypothetical protein